MIFASQEPVERDGAVDFPELLELRSARFLQARAREEAALETLSEQVGTEIEKRKLVPSLRVQVADKTRLLSLYIADRGKLVAKGSEDRMTRLEEVSRAAELVRGHIRLLMSRYQTLLTIQDEVSDLRQNQAPERLRRMKERHRTGGIKEEQWPAFLQDYKGSVDDVLRERMEGARKLLDGWKGTAPAIVNNPQVSYIAASVELAKQPLAVLEAEIARLERLVGGDREIADKFAALSRKITAENSALESLKARLDDCEQAEERLKKILDERESTYLRVFEALLSGEAVLKDLYAPLTTRIAGGAKSLKKLSFSVRRVADIQAWAVRGEQLLDLRAQGPFKGRGSLRSKAEKLLKAAWEKGTAEEASSAMVTFREETRQENLDLFTPTKGDQGDYRAWAKRWAKWLYSTDHISIRYSINYDGVDIRKLSPGTRGIVLLLLYLALDDADDRPLIIDQPEENLDPQSIFDELVGLFLDVKKRRQVIIVTHNANLVVNTDADQIIIASAGAHLADGLPNISYAAGGLESSDVRTSVCNILEGGEVAFRERARRLRVALER